MQNKNIQRLIAELALPNEYLKYISRYFEPIVNIINDLSQQKHVPIIGINGSQGSGKTTAAIVLKTMLETQYGHQVVVVSIDDFYHSKAKRLELSKSVHPLFVTRGVPGTHDIELALRTFLALKNASGNDTILIPRFDKAIDDRKSKSQWETVQGSVSVIIFEGWCVGAPALDNFSLDVPINELEANEDQAGTWRQVSNQFLSKEYQTLFNQIDWLLMLQAPSFEVVYEWRLLQEQKLAQSIKSTQNQLLNEKQLERFIQHYQRLTEHCLLTMPILANAVVTLDEQHRMASLSVK